jgi:SagB-type dehydrogenase family enzyme
MKNLRRAVVPRYRRAPFLISYWKENLLFYENYLTGKIVGASAETAEVLDFFDDWRTVVEMGRRWPQYTAQSLRSTVRQLAQQTLLERATGKHIQESELVRALRRWRTWNPAASFFHLSTKDAYSGEISEEEIRYVEELMKGRAVPRPTKRRVGANIVELWGGPPSTTSEFSQVLRGRRTWREFSPAKVDQKSFGTLMELSFAVQQWQAIPNAGKFPLKTSPSGGSLHPLEAYVLVRKVEGLTPGIYHYDAIGRRLSEVRRGATAAEIQKLLAGQWWFRDAAVVVFLTAVFGRTQWKYDYARAYRAILIEAGHLCQTFCLTASWLGLAPFCTVAMKDSAIEKALKVDGISESVIYAMGAGVRPAETQRKSR